jgi:hypothetical protein
MVGRPTPSCDATPRSEIDASPVNPPAVIAVRAEVVPETVASEKVVVRCQVS